MSEPSVEELHGELRRLEQELVLLAHAPAAELNTWVFPCRRCAATRERGAAYGYYTAEGLVRHLADVHREPTP